MNSIIVVAVLLVATMVFASSKGE